MRTIEVEDDVYEYLLMNAQEIGESASDILRRLLGFSVSGGAADRLPTGVDPDSRALFRYVQDGELADHRTATARYLTILRFVHQQKPNRFQSVLQVAGTKRRYFSRSRESILQSGSSTKPRQIPGTEFWALTNAPTAQKKDILERVLKQLGYAEPAIRAARRALD